ncbi:arsenite efflux ATP-binding protein ArsA [Alteribacillus persepolensis]|uniref:Arsenite efflux ATP-binding protein ArsA n=1 Tax=Alteribacillus persepolensis TaxID=568899 RepID=A0A1G8FIK7_9BACI|nr:ArsA family ATPase [Alteribacillus persepolensis]SDH81980.1 arsenite efflux ATP-binding protein ArsA [Alteribacillus persepolensis]
MDKLLRYDIVFFGGKGGVGKSTSSSAFALAAAERGKRTLLVSTDPAHNLSDLFHTTIGDDKKQLAHNLWGMEVSSEKESKRYINEVKGNLQGLVKSHMAEEVNRQIDMAAVSPGSEEAALFDRLVQIVIEEVAHFDMIVFDTAPTGHTVRLLSLPEMMEAWIEGMLQRRQAVNENYSQWLHDGEPVDDPIYRVLMNRKDRFSKARKVLMDKKRTAYVYVLVPEKLPIAETKRALALLHQARLDVNALVVNKCMPPHAGDSVFIEKRRKQEQYYMEQIQHTFPKQQKIYLPLMEEDVSSRTALGQVKEEFLFPSIDI